MDSGRGRASVRTPLMCRPETSAPYPTACQSDLQQCGRSQTGVILRPSTKQQTPRDRQGLPNLTPPPPRTLSMGGPPSSPSLLSFHRGWGGGDLSACVHYISVCGGLFLHALLRQTNLWHLDSLWELGRKGEAEGGSVRRGWKEILIMLQPINSWLSQTLVTIHRQPPILCHARPLHPG